MHTYGAAGGTRRAAMPRAALAALVTLVATAVAALSAVPASAHHIELPKVFGPDGLEHYAQEYQIGPIPVNGKVTFPVTVRNDYPGTVPWEFDPWATTDTASPPSGTLAAHETITVNITVTGLFPGGKPVGGHSWFSFSGDFGHPGGTGYDLAFRRAYTMAANQPPTISTVSIPAAPLTSDTITATVAAADPDGDPVTLAYQWYRNDVAIAGATAASLDLSVAGHGDVGDRVHVVVTATDGQATSALVSSNTATVVANTPVCPVPAARDARTHIEAETWNDQDQVTTWGPCIGISHLDQGDWIRYDNVDFGATSPTKLVMRLGTPDWFAGKKIYLRADTATGPVIATLTTQGTGADWDNFEAVEQTAKVTGPITGTHRVFLTGPSIAEAPLGFGLGNIDWFTFTD